MRFKEYKFLVYSDLYRITDSIRFLTLLRHVVCCGSFKYTFWMRTCTYTRGNPWLRYSVYPFAKVMLYRLKYRLGISIPPSARIGSGFYISNFGGIFVNEESVIGKNCNISQGVTLGLANRGKNRGFPTLGDNVYIGPGAKLVGAVRVGDNVAIGANCVVTKDVPDNSVVVGIPGRVISQKGSEYYVNRTDYEDKLARPSLQPTPGSELIRES